MHHLQSHLSKWIMKRHRSKICSLLNDFLESPAFTLVFLCLSLDVALDKINICEHATSIYHAVLLLLVLCSIFCGHRSSGRV